MRLAKDAVLEWTPKSSSMPPRRERILSLEYAGDRVILYDIDAPNAWPTETSRTVLEQALRLRTAKILLVDPYSHLSPLENDSGKTPPQKPTDQKSYDVYRDTIYKKLAPALEGKWGDLLDPDQRPGIITHLVKHTNWPRHIVTKYIRRWWQRGQIKNAFLPHYNDLSAPGRKCAAITVLVKSGSQQSVPRRCPGRSNTAPLPLDSSEMLIGPDAVYQIDATVLDVYVVSSFNHKRVIRRPELKVHGSTPTEPYSSVLQLSQQ